MRASSSPGLPARWTRAPQMTPWASAVAARGGRWLQGRDSGAARGQRELPCPQHLRKVSCDTGQRGKIEVHYIPDAFERDVSPGSMERRRQFSPPPSTPATGHGWVSCHREWVQVVAPAPEHLDGSWMVSKAEQGTRCLGRFQEAEAASIPNSLASPTWSHGRDGDGGHPSLCTIAPGAGSPQCPFSSFLTWAERKG